VGVQDAGDAAVGRALGADDRVQHAHDAQAARLQLGAHGVHQEGQVSVLVSRHRAAGS
jgi:hypothetical protein